MPRKLSILLPVIVSATTVAFAFGTLGSPEQAAVKQTPIIKPPPRETAKVHVTFGPKHEPLVGAEIRWVGIPSAASRGAEGESEEAAERRSLLAGVPALAATDEHGDAEVILEGRRMLVEARAGALWGAQEYDSELQRNNPVVPLPELSVALDFDLSVKVLDAHGAPVASAPVSIRSGEGSHAFDRGTSATDASGRVTLQHAGYDMNVEASGRPSRFSVVVSGCFSPSVAASVDCSHAPAQPIELRLPPTGEVELAYEEADGTPISIQGGAAIVPRWDASSIGPEPKPLPLWEWRDAGTDVVRAPAQSSVVFSRVGLGSHLTAWTQRNSLSAAARREFEGPSKEGERVRVVLHPPEVAQIRGQFVDEQLKPRPGVEISARALELPPSGGWNYMNAPGDWVQEKQLGSRLLSESPDLMRADAQGRFRLDLDRSEFESEDVRLAFIEDQGQPSERRAIAQLDDPRPAGPIDLGPLKLSPAPVIAAGVVHDEAGLPLGGVEVCVLDNGGGLRGARFQTTSAPNGSFKLIATCLDKRVELRLTGLDLVDKTLREMEVGNSSAQIVMQRAGRIRGRVVVPAGIEPRSVSVGWTPEAKELRDSLGYGMTQPDADARFEISGLAPGTYSIRVSWKGTRSNPGLSRKEVRVDAGMITDLGEIQSAAEGK